MYNTDINIIAGIQDQNFILDIIRYFYEGYSDLQILDIIEKSNKYDIRTKKSKKRFLISIKESFLQFINTDNKLLFISIFKQDNILSIKQKMLFFQFAINNDLFYDLTVNITSELYIKGINIISTSNFIPYLFSLKEKFSELKDWSDSTITIVGSKYLTLLKKFGLAEGRMTKRINMVSFDDSTIILAIYLIKSLDKSSSDFLQNKYFPLFFTSPQHFIDRIKKISMIDYFEVSTLGYDLKIDLKYSFGEIVNAVISGN